MAFLTTLELEAFGFKHLGKNVLLSDKASVYGAHHISIGDNSRIDDFCILSAGSGGITIGRNVHIACYVSLIGQAAIEISDFAGISGKCSVYSSSDDFSGTAMTGPTVDAEFTNVQHQAVHIGRHSLIGAGCVILPGVTIADGVAVGALSLIARNCDAFSIYIGSPAKRVKERSRHLLDIEKEYLKKNPNTNAS